MNVRVDIGYAGQTDVSTHQAFLAQLTHVAYQGLMQVINKEEGLKVTSRIYGDFQVVFVHVKNEHAYDGWLRTIAGQLRVAEAIGELSQHQ